MHLPFYFSNLSQMGFKRLMCFQIILKVKVLVADTAECDLLKLIASLHLKIKLCSLCGFTDFFLKLLTMLFTTGYVLCIIILADWWVPNGERAGEASCICKPSDHSSMVSFKSVSYALHNLKKTNKQSNKTENHFLLCIGFPHANHQPLPKPVLKNCAESPSLPVLFNNVA